MRMLPSFAGAATAALVALTLAAAPAAAVSVPAAAAVASASAHDHDPAAMSGMHHEMPADDPDSGAEMIGRPAPAWTFTRWIGPPLSLAGLRGKVVLVRWWNEGCRFCAATLPAIERLRVAHGGDGLVVVGVV